MRKKATNPYRRLDRAERAAGLDKTCRQMARSWADRRRRSPTRWRATALCREGRARAAGPPGADGRAPGCCRGRIAAEVPQVPLRAGRGAASLGGQGAGARRRRTARIQDGRGPGRGRVRIHNGPDKVRSSRAGCRPSRSRWPGRLRSRPRRPPYRWIARLRRDEQPRLAQEVRLPKPRSHAKPRKSTAHGEARSHPRSWDCPTRIAPPPARWTPSWGSRPTGGVCSHCTPAVQAPADAADA